MSRFDVVVFVNVPFSVLGWERAQALGEFVEAGASCSRWPALTPSGKEG